MELITDDGSTRLCNALDYNEKPSYPSFSSHPYTGKTTMKYIFLVFVGIIFLNKIKCHVTEKVKTSEVTIGLPKDEEVKISENKLEVIKSVKTDGGRVYLEDVVYALKHQNWTAEELPCLNQTLLILRSLQNFTLWAVWEWDSVSSQPQGLLFGNRYELGNFDECMNAPWASSHPELMTQYCLADIVLERTDNAVRRRTAGPVGPYQSVLDFMQYRQPHTRPLNELTWGACVPALCGPTSVQRLMATMLARSHLGMAGMRPRIAVTEPCQRVDQPRQFDGVFYAFIAVMGSLCAIVLICSYLNCKKEDRDPENLKDKIVKAFCLKENAKSLLVMKKEGFEVLYGIRFLTICFIVMDHQVGISNSGPVSDGARVDQIALSAFGMFLLHDDLFVDTFFLLSGLLTATTFCRFKKLPNPFFFIIKRYIRLVVALAVVIFYVCAVYPYTGSGPLWNRAIEGETTPCRKNWWLSLLMLNNYVNSENICIVVSWYIPCDFHFFIVAVVMYWLYKSFPRLGLAGAGVLAIASVIAPGVINYVNGMPAVQLFTYEFIKDPRASLQFHLTYIKSHTRFTAYIIGFFTGYIFTSYSATGNINRISQKWSILGAGAGLLIMTVTMCLGPTYLVRDYHPAEGAVYAALNRPVWAAGAALLVLCCSLGHVPLINPFLSWYPWVPLSRLSYGLYLTHSVFIIRNTLVSRNPQHNDPLQMLAASAGIIVIGCISALVIWLVAEAPVNNLLELCLKSTIKRKATSDGNNQAAIQRTGVDTLASMSVPGSSGYLPKNLPATVQFSSKV